MLIKATGVVRLTRDVEIKYTNSGNAIANFSVASSEKYKTQSGEQKEKVMFIDCVAFSKLGEICNQYLRKGSKIFIIGKLELQQWTDSNGQKRSKHSLTIENMEMLDSKADSQSNQQGGYQNQAPQQSQYAQPQGQGSNQQNQNNHGGQQQQNSYKAPKGNSQLSMQQQGHAPREVPQIDIDED